MAKRTGWLLCRILATLGIIGGGLVWVWAQQTERPGNSRDDRHKMGLASISSCLRRLRICAGQEGCRGDSRY